jgi:hypothetical protein
LHGHFRRPLHFQKQAVLFRQGLHALAQLTKHCRGVERRDLALLASGLQACQIRQVLEQ